MDIWKPPMPSNEFIPHQMGLMKTQPKNLIMGKPVVIPFHQMGAGAGEHIMMLKPANARKLLTAYKKGKGIKIRLTPEEIHHTIHHGRGFFDWAKKAYKSVSGVVSSALKNPLVREVAKQGVHYGADALGTTVGTYFGNPEAGYMVGDILGRSAEHAIDNRSVSAGGQHLVGSAKQKGKEVAYDAIKQNISKLPAEVQPIARKALDQSLSQTHGQAEAQAEHNMGFGIRRRGRPAKGGLIGGTHGLAPKGMGLTGGRLVKGSPEAKAYMASIRSRKSGKGMWDWADPKKNGVAKAFDPKQNGVSDAFNKTFTPALGNQIVDGLKVAGHYGIPAITGALGGLAGTALSGNPVGGVAGSALGSYAGNQIDKAIGIGIRRGRGRPRKSGGSLASASSAYQQALRNNFDGLVLNSASVNNAPVSNFKVNPRVRPSSTEMTLSPYQSMSSPAMNPFIPTSYRQMGGTSCGYGGRGLTGGGLVGGGLYGASGGYGLY